jgi:hypothetical protein
VNIQPLSMTGLITFGETSNQIRRHNQRIDCKQPNATSQKGRSCNLFKSFYRPRVIRYDSLL